MLTVKLPVALHGEAGDIPVGLVFAIRILLNDTGLPLIVAAPAPPKTTVPVLEKLFPKFKLMGEPGMKFIVPLLVMIPLFVNDPRRL